MYRLVVSPSPFRESFIDGRIFASKFRAWWAALWYTIVWPLAEVEIQERT